MGRISKILLAVVLLFSFFFNEALGQAPIISSVSPEFGPVGSTVTLAGTNFTDATDATIDRQRASFQVNTVTTDGGAMDVFGSANQVSIVNNTIYGDNAGVGGGLDLNSHETDSYKINVVSNNSVSTSDDEFSYAGSGAAIDYNAISTGALGMTGNSKDPFFSDPTNGDSNALPADDGDIVEDVPLDLPGNARIINSLVNQGAFEFDVLALAAEAGNALVFDGISEFVSFARNTVASGLTYEAWINTVSTDAISDYIGNAALSVIGDHDNSIRNSFGIHGGIVRYTHFDGSWFSVDGQTPVNDGSWHHIAVTHNSGTGEILIYVDGIVDGSGNINYSAGASYDRIGGSYFDGSGIGDLFDGQIDEVRIWSTPLSETAITANIFEIVDPSEVGLVLNYRFDEETGTSSLDNSISTNNGTLIGFGDPDNSWVLSNALSNFIPADPLDLFATEVTDSRIDLAWTDQAFNENGYRVERSEDGTTFVEVATLSVDEDQYQDLGVSPSTGYWYRVRAVNEVGFSGYSNEKFGSTFDVPHNALDFNGASDYIIVNSHPTLELTVGSWETWVKLDDKTSNKRLIFKSNSSDFSVFELFYNQPTDNFKAEVEVGAVRYEATTSSSITAGTWYHVAATYDGADLRIYFNGTEEGVNSTPSGDMDVNDGDLGLGANPSGTIFQFLAGELDEVRIWDDVRTAVEISNNRFNTLKGSEANLVAYYRFDQGTADGSNTSVTTLPDRSTNQNQGLLTGFTLTTGPTSNWTSSGAMTVAPFTVVNTNDTGLGSLRQAITDANASGSKETITFNIPGIGPWNIEVASALPNIDNTTDLGMIIDGTTQPTWDMDAGLMVTIDGTSSTGNGLRVENPNVEIYGLHIFNHTSQGITTTSGADELIIGAPGKGNVVSGNGSRGIYILNTNIALIQANRIGTSMDGLSTDATTRNEEDGVSVLSASSNIQIGGNSFANEGNLISGNAISATAYGIEISNTDNVDVFGNLIGTDKNGENDLGNGRGIHISSGANGVNIGGTNTGEYNVIAGSNSFAEISIDNTSTTVVVEGNTIGLNSAGDTKVDTDGTTVIGILLSSSGTGMRFVNNTISGLSGQGIDLATITSNVEIQNNYIGTNTSGAGTGLGNSGHGISVRNSSGVDNTTERIEITGNVISDNGNGAPDFGIELDNTVSNVLITNNLIGVEQDGSTPLGNIGNGIWVSAQTTFVDISTNTIAHNGINGLFFDDQSSQGAGMIIGTNSYFCNTNSAIHFGNGPTVEAPFINIVDASEISGTSSAEDGSVVLIYETNASCADIQGAQLLGTATVTLGDWTYTSAVNTSNTYVATVTDVTNGISEFSDAFEPIPPFAFNATLASISGFRADFSTPAGATNILIDVDDDPTFGSLLVDGESAGTVGFHDVATTLTAGTVYYYRARSDYGVFQSVNAEANPFMVRPGNALNFDGIDNDVRISDQDDFDFGINSFTIESWFQTSSVKTSQTIIDKRVGSGTFTGYQLYLNGGTPRVQLNSSAGLTEFTFTGTYNDGDWHHIAMAVDRTGNTLQVFVDGVLSGIAENISSVGDLDNNEILHIGGHTTDVSSFGFQGSIDQVRFWDSARTLEEIQDNLYNELVGNNSNLVAYYRFDQGLPGSSNGPETTLIDMTYKGHEGTLVSFDLLGSTSNWITSEAQTPALYSVVNTNDAGIGSLRQAIIDANTSGSQETITFNYFDEGPWQINLESALPIITNANGMVIDGTSQLGWSFGDSEGMVRINGATNGVNAPGFDIQAPNVGIYGMIIVGMQGTSSGTGINIQGEANDGVIIGAAGMGNVIHGNAGSGISITDADNAIIQGNRIGVSTDGLLSEGNSGSHGIALSGSDGTVIGGDQTAGEGNVISGNGGTVDYDIQVVASNNVDIYGNFIGTDTDGENDLTNNRGINISTGSDNINIGGSIVGQANVIAGHEGFGIIIQGGTNVIVDSNIIGLGISGTTAIPNNGDGIAITTDGVGMIIRNNVISANTDDGIDIDGVQSALRVEQNLIGTTASGTTGSGSLGNNNHGINISSSDGLDNISNQITIIDNVISGNGTTPSNHGINFILTNSNVVVKGNKIGVEGDGVTSLKNSGNGIEVSDGSSQITIGGIATLEENTIANHPMSGVNFAGAGGQGSAVTGNTIYCNDGGGITFGATPTLFAPGITSISLTTISGTAVGTTGDLIHVYAANDACLDDQGFSYMGEATLSGVTWSLPGSFDLQENYTATLTTLSEGTSEFSSAASGLLDGATIQFGGDATATSGELTITNVDFLQDSGDEILFGHDAASFIDAATDMTNIPADTRIDRSWYIDVTDVTATGTGGDVSLNFDFGGSFSSEITYYLIYRSGSTGEFSLAQYDGYAVSGNSLIFTADAQNLPEGSYTIGFFNTTDDALFAIDFDGVEDYVRVEDNTDIEIAQYTIETWFNIENQPSTDQTYTMLQEGTSDGTLNRSGFELSYRDVAGNKELVFGHVDVSDGLQEVIVPNSISEGVWHHAAATYDGTTITLYIDGIEAGDLVTGNGPSYVGDAQDFKIGAGETNIGITAFFDGLIDQVRIWNSALTSNDLQSEMDRSQNLDGPAGLVAIYRFDQNSGTNVPDLSGNGNVGVSLDNNTGDGDVPAMWLASTAFVEPGITISTLTVDSGPAIQGAKDQLIYKYQVNVSDGIASALGFYISLSGHAEADFDGFKLYRNIGSDDFASATVIGTPSFNIGVPAAATDLGLLFGEVYEPGSSGFFYLTADISESAALNVFNVVAPTDENFGFVRSNTTASLTTGPALSIVAQPDNALAMEGTSHVLSDNDLGITGDAAATLEAWIQTNNTSTGQIVLTFGDIATAGRAMAISINLNGAGSVSASFAGGNNVSTAAGVISAGTYHHIAIVKVPGSTATTTIIYVDGIEVPIDAAASITPNFGAGNVYVGRFGNAVTGLEFDGTIDEVRVWAAERTGDQIRANMFTSLGATTDLQLAYDFNEGFPEGDNTNISLLEDTSGNGNNGSFVGVDLTGTTSNFVASLAFLPSGGIPTTQARDITTNSVDMSSAGIAWTNGDGQRRIVAVAEGIPSAPTPTTTVYYDPNPAFGLGDDLGGGWFTVYNGFDNKASVSGLTEVTEYSVAVFEVNNPVGFDVYNTNTALNNPSTFTTQGIPEINVKGTISNNIITDGDLVPTAANETDFESVGFAGSRTINYTIENTGLENLIITDINPEGDFTVSGISLPMTISPVGQTTFDLTYNPFDEGLDSGKVTIDNNDPDESAYDFVVSGFGENNALDFAGTDDQIDLGNPSQFNFGTSSFTLEAWFNPTDLTGVHQIFYKNNGSAPVTGYYIRTNEDQLEAGFGDGSSSVEFFAPVTLVIGVWYHVALVRDITQAEAYVYLNGNLVEIIGDATGSIDFTSNLFIGGGSSVPAENFVGTIDEVRIWDNARSGLQIRQSAGSTLVGSESNLQGYFGFDEGVSSGDNSGLSSVGDMTTNSNDGLLSGFDQTGFNSNFIPSTAFDNLLPDIAVIESGVDLSAGEAFDFGLVDIGEDADVLLDIENHGFADLTISVPVTTTGDFSIISQPSNTIIAPGDGESIIVRFTPSVVGLAGGSVDVNSDDIDENPLTINVFGVGASFDMKTISTLGLITDNSAGLIITDDGFLIDTGDQISWGHNGRTTIEVNDGLSNVPVVVNRWDREWEVIAQDEFVNAGNVRMGFDFSDAGIGGSADFNLTYYLLYRPDALSDFEIFPYHGYSIEDQNSNVDASDDDRVEFNVNADFLLGGLYTLGISGGQPGNAMGFDNTDDIISFGDNFNGIFGGPDNTFTIEGWFNPTDLSSDDEVLFSKASSVACGEDQRQLTLSIGDGDKITLLYAGNLTAATHRIVQSDVAVLANEWQHIAVTYDGNIDTGDGADRVEFYLNGVQTGKNVFSVGGTFPFDMPGFGTAHAALGSNVSSNGDLCNSDPSEAYSGEMDEFRIWNTVRTASEVQNNAAFVVNASFESDLMAYYRFDQVGLSNDNLPDHSGNNMLGIWLGFGSPSTEPDWITSAAMQGAPEVSVEGNGIEILNGDATPDSADDTDFGISLVGIPVTKTFTIVNSGSSVLNLAGSPVDITGTGFSVSAQPAITTIPNLGGSTTFDVTFTPTISNTVSATVSIGNDDADENPYTFDVTGFGNTAPTAITLTTSAIDENSTASTVVGSFASVDAEGGAFTYSFESDGGTFDVDNLSFSISGDDLVIEVSPDFELQSSYSIYARSDDGNGGVFDQNLTVLINDLNDNVPDIIIGGPFFIDENSADGTSVTTASATDADAGSIFTWSITTGNTDVDSDANPAFVIDPSTGEITVNDVDDLDFESGTTSFTLQIVVEDGANSTGTPVNINLNNLNDNTPVITPDGPFNINENTTAGTSIVTMLAIDADVTDIFTWSIASGNDDVDSDANTAFSIDPATGSITVNDADDLDYETGTIFFDLVIEVSDGTNVSVQETLTINIDDLNDEVPVIAPVSAFAVDENIPFGTVLTILTVTDADAIGTNTWSIVSGNIDDDTDGNDAIAIDPSTGQITVGDSDDLDFERTTSISLEIGINDGVNSSGTETIIININDLDDNAPVITPAGPFVIDENTINSSAVTTLVGTDLDAISILSWSIIGGDDDVDSDSNPPFSIDTNSGEITVNDSDDLDFESGTTSFSLTIEVSDGINTDTELIQVDLNDLNDEVPVITSVGPFSIDENTSLATSIVFMNAVDNDTGGTLTWSIVTGNVDIDSDGGEAFAIDANTGEITVSDAEDLDFESIVIFDLVIEVNDGVNTSTTETVTINLNDLDDNPPVIAVAGPFTLDENTDASTPIATMTASDADAISTVTWSIVGGDTDVDSDTNLPFFIDNNTGELIVSDAGDLDFESGVTTFSLDIQAFDGFNADVETIQIDINDVNDNPPTVQAAGPFSIDENEANANEITTMVVSDLDATNTFTWSIVTGNSDVDSDGQNAFSIDVSTGQITVNDSEDLDFESGTTSFNLDITVNDGISTSAVETIAININDINDEIPVITPVPAIDLNENSISGTPLATFGATDGDADNTFIWDIISGNADLDSDGSDAFAIDAASGSLTVNDQGDLDFENGTVVFSLSIQVSDGTNNSATETITINITDVNDEVPVITSSNTVSVDENQVSTLTVTATDADAGDALTYALSGGTDKAFFTIDGATGEMTFTTAPDFENPGDSNGDNFYEVEVSATDLNTNTGVLLTTVEVLDVVETPTALAASNIGSFEFTANFEPFDGALRMALDVAFDDSFNTFVDGYKNFVTTNSSEIVNDLYHKSNYHYRVRGILGIGDTTVYSNVISVLLPESPELRADSLALVDVYLNTSGGSWTDNDNWLQNNGTTLRDWFGLAYDNGRITEINLPNNNLDGFYPAPSSGLGMVSKIDLQNNQLVGVGDLTGLTALTTSSVNVSGNAIDFSSLETITDLNIYNLGAQQTLLDPESRLEQLGVDFILNRTIGGANNSYTWFKDGTEVTGEVNATLTIVNPTFADEGIYRAEVTNTQVAGLTIITSDIDIKVSSLERDEEALMAIYNGLNGAAWNAGGFQGWQRDAITVDSWTGVTVTSNRVVALDLTGIGGVDGTLVDDVLDIEALQSLNLSGHQISELADLSDLTALSLTTVNVSNNILDFGGLESNASLVGQGGVTFTYAPQTIIQMTVAEDTIPKGSNGLASVTVGGGNNTFQWFLNGNTVASSDTDSYTVENIDFNNMGEYHCEITDTRFPDLTIESTRDNILASLTVMGKIIDQDGLEVTEGTVRFFRITAPNTPYDTTNVATVGASGYAATKVVLADYLISVEADEEKYIPSFYVNTSEWVRADTLFLRTEDQAVALDVGIEKIPEELTEGDGRVFGIVEEEFEDETGRLLPRRRSGRAGCAFRRSRGVSRPGADDEEELLAYVLTNDDGEFDVEFLPVGTYRLSIEIPGVPMDETSFVTFTIGEDGIEQNTLELGAVINPDGIVVTLINEVGIYRDYFKDLTVFPNPASDYLTVSYKKLLTVGVKMQLVDLTGAVHHEEVIQDGYNLEQQIDVSNLENGVYLLNFVDPSKGNLNIVAMRIMINR